VEKYIRAGQATNDDIILRMRYTCRITKGKDTHSQYVTIFAFPFATMFMRTRLNITFICTLPVFCACFYVVLCLKISYGEPKPFLKCPVKLSINKISKPGTHPESQRALTACGKRSRIVLHESFNWYIKRLIPFAKEVEFYMNLYQSLTTFGPVTV